MWLFVPLECELINDLGITAVYPQGLEQWVPFSRWFINVQRDEWTKGSRGPVRRSLKYSPLIYLICFFTASLWFNITYCMVVKRIQMYEVPPRSQTLLVLTLRTYHLRGSLIFCLQKEKQPTTSFLHQWEPIIYGLPFLQFWKEFYNQLWPHFSNAEPFRDALKTAHLCTFCFTCWATNIIYTLMKAVLLWIFLRKKIFFIGPVPLHHG